MRSDVQHLSKQFIFVYPMNNIRNWVIVVVEDNDGPVKIVSNVPYILGIVMAVHTYVLQGIRASLFSWIVSFHNISRIYLWVKHLPPHPPPGLFPTIPSPDTWWLPIGLAETPHSTKIVVVFSNKKIPHQGTSSGI